MEIFNFFAFKKRTADILEREEVPSPVKIELLNIGMNVIYETVASKDAYGTWVFSNEHFPTRSLQETGPFTVRFSPKGRESFTKPLLEQGAAAV